MDKLKDHWQKVGLGAAALLVCYLAYRSMKESDKLAVDADKTPRL